MLQAASDQIAGSEPQGSTVAQHVHTGAAPLLHVCPSKGRFPEPLKNLA